MAKNIKGNRCLIAGCWRSHFFHSTKGWEWLNFIDHSTNRSFVVETKGTLSNFGYKSGDNYLLVQELDCHCHIQTRWC